MTGIWVSVVMLFAPLTNGQTHVEAHSAVHRTEAACRQYALRQRAELALANPAASVWLGDQPCNLETLPAESRK